MARYLWRIATDTPDYGADDLTGKGAEKTGGRWNRKGTPLIYSSSSIALACLETLVHLAGGLPLPLNRYLVQITIPPTAWRKRAVFDRAAHVGWDAEPPGLVSMDWGTQWARSGTHLLAEVPSVVVPEESNILINPAHASAAHLSVRKLRQWRYDLRLSLPSPT
jgi:RES domain-containing protein